MVKNVEKKNIVKLVLSHLAIQLIHTHTQIPIRLGVIMLNNVTWHFSMV